MPEAAINSRRHMLASAGYRVIVPYLRGYGTTSFLSNETFRNGQQCGSSGHHRLMDTLGSRADSIGARDGRHHGALWRNAARWSSL